MEKRRKEIKWERAMKTGREEKENREEEKKRRRREGKGKMSRCEQPAMNPPSSRGDACLSAERGTWVVYQGLLQEQSACRW